MAIAPNASQSHNRKLYDEWMASFGIRYTVKPISEQVKTLKIESDKLFRHGYNPSIIRFGNRLFMAYRYHTGTPATSLAMAELNDSGVVLWNRKIDLPSGSKEDPKLFSMAGNLWMSWVESGWPQSAICVVKCGRLIEGDPWKLEDVVRPPYGRNDGTATEKSFVFFEHKEKAYFIYQSTPEQIIVEWEPEIVEHKTPFPKWRYGTVKGGTAPMPYKDKLLRFVHGTLDNELKPWWRRYYIAAVLMEPEPPFKTIAISKEPIIRGSEVGTVDQVDCRHFKAQVAFPGGAIKHGDGFLLSVGCNDCECLLAEIGKGDLHL